jgi:hypothetical protein
MRSRGITCFHLQCRKLLKTGDARRMASSGMLPRVALVSSSETSVLTRATRRNIPEDAILHSHCRENLKSYSNEAPSCETLIAIYKTTRRHSDLHRRRNVSCIASVVSIGFAAAGTSAVLYLWCLLASHHRNVRCIVSVVSIGFAPQAVYIYTFPPLDLMCVLPEGQQFESRYCQEFYLLDVLRTGCGGRPASCPMGTEGAFPRVETN